MAATNYTPIILYHSATGAAAPLAADLAAGELAINTTDEKLYFKNAGGTAKVLANAAIAGITPGTGVATALAVAVGSAGAVVVLNGALGTPSSGTLTNCTFPTLNQDTTGKSAKTDALNSATTVVNVSSATAPSTGQVLMATSSTAATWQTPSAAFNPAAPGPIGGTTPGSGAFTTLSATSTSGAISNVSASGANQSAYTRYRPGSPSTSDVYVGVDTASAGINGVIGGAGLVWNAANYGLAFGTNNTLRMTITDAGATSILNGLAVTGAISATGTISTAGSGSPQIISATTTNTGGYAKLAAIADTAFFNVQALGSTFGGTLWAGVSGSNQVVLESGNSASSVVVSTGGGQSIYIAPGRAKVLEVSSTGLAVTGALSATGASQTNPVYVGPSSGALGTTYSVVSLNNDTTYTGMVGMWGNGGTDTSLNLNVPTGKAITLRAGGANCAIINASGISIDPTVTPSSGIGIKFPATQNPSSDANTLDDYEEGTWTPTQGSGLTVVGTFSSSGKYVKIGKQVTITANIVATSIAIAQQQIICGGLPFTAELLGGYGIPGSVIDANNMQSGACNCYSNSVYAANAFTAVNSFSICATYFV